MTTQRQMGVDRWTVHPLPLAWVAPADTNLITSSYRLFSSDVRDTGGGPVHPYTPWRLR